MARLVRAIHFPETENVLHRFWKMDGRHKGGHDELKRIERRRRQLGGPLLRAMTSFFIPRPKSE
jgi:hypothetical protein